MEEKESTINNNDNNNTNVGEETLTKQQKKNKKKREAAKKKKQDVQKVEEVEKGTSQDVDVKNQEKGTSPDADVKYQKTTDTSPSTPIANTTDTVITKEVDNFEEELCWCINQLELGLKTQKPTKDQDAKNRKLLNQLRSQKTPKPKKRMLMRTTFGNYRQEMAKELKKYQTAQPKLVNVDENALKKSTFLRKRVSDLPEVANDVESKQGMFRFDFPDPT